MSSRGRSQRTVTVSGNNSIADNGSEKRLSLNDRFSQMKTGPIKTMGDSARTERRGNFQLRGQSRRFNQVMSLRTGEPIKNDDFSLNKDTFGRQGMIKQIPISQ